jgi:hypothetical protein
MALEPITATGLAAWASYLINGDDSGIDATDKAQADAFATYLGAMPVSCGDDSFYGRPEFPSAAPYGECLEYTALIEKDS